MATAMQLTPPGPFESSHARVITVLSSVHGSSTDPYINATLRPLYKI
jgi:hypothetical protein